MQEDFLHYIWKYKKFDFQNLKTVDGKSVIITSFGQHNHDAGPDFFNAQLKIDGQTWAGNVEIHIKSSDWYVHRHEKDKAYDNVILHVVWEHDADIYRADNSVLDTLELKPYVNPKLLAEYEKLMYQSNAWINCENDFNSIDNFTLENWLERLYLERLQCKSEDINQLLKKAQNDWEAVLFIMLARAFGLKVNGSAFLSMAQSIPFSIVRKVASDGQDLESLFFGQSGLLDLDSEDAYFKDLKKRYFYLKQKFQFENGAVESSRFFRLRPPNFPTIRLAQLATLYTQQNLFSKVIQTNTLDDFYKLLCVTPSNYWQTHYNFGTPSKASKKKMTKPFVDLLLINAIIPLKFSYAKANGKTIDSELLDVISEIKLESNSIVDKFFELKPMKKSALTSQALIQLKNNYCDKNRCVSCAIGNQLILGNN
ncbi:DUF2851 family protein [Winogradskyella maritima]|uniref:DUF2851 family protein n=1 Tax=Winogradskyella maritima TaxID=1517766 RepID=A0ABV8AGD1_9FLAO|nr:DUF2851 family protein [Winogradskyella maritima]